MKLTKSYLKKVIKEELKNLSEVEVSEPEQQTQAAPEDKVAKKAGASAVSQADKLVDAMLAKLGALSKSLEQVKLNPTKKLALARALLIKVVEMDPQVIDKMIQQLSQGTAK